MTSRIYRPVAEVFLALAAPRARLGDWVTALAPLTAASMPAVTGIDAYYDADADADAAHPRRR